jgi:hypothetical protein
MLDQLKHLTEQQTLNDLEHYTNLTNTAHDAVIQCSDDICLSVPYILGYNPEQKSSPQIPRAFNDNLLLWPLYNAGLTRQIPEIQRRWIIERFIFIAEVTGVKQALQLVHRP